MAYSELVKNFAHIREYMREFYVYGFRSRDEFNKKSGRSYDDERRRIESWLGEYMQFRQTASGKNVFLSIDSRSVRHNPLYKGWKAKSFTDGEITLHFMLFDIFRGQTSDSAGKCGHTGEEAEPLTLTEITVAIDERLACFEIPRHFDESTVRKKLKEYEAEGLIISEKKGKTAYYRRTADIALPGRDCLDFFSETAPCGVVGSFLLDRFDGAEDAGGCFAFKHHYITGAMDSEIVCDLFQAMREKKSVLIDNRTSESVIVPLKIFISVQSGRQYLVGYSPALNRMRSFRTDNIISVKMGEPCADFDIFRGKLEKMCSHMWGVSMQSTSGQRIEHVEFTVSYGDGEQHIHRRLEREKRCGTVEKIDGNTSRFSADVYDASELVPWIRTFICRIRDIHFSNKALEQQFRSDLEAMYALYDVEGGEQR